VSDVWTAGYPTLGAALRKYTAGLYPGTEPHARRLHRERTRRRLRAKRQERDSRGRFT